MRQEMFVVSALAASAMAGQAHAQVTAAQTPCQVEAAKSSAVKSARLRLAPMPADPRYNLTVDDYTRAPKSLAGLRSWIQANPRHLCTADARALLAPREARVKFFADARTAGEQPAKRTRAFAVDASDYPRQSTGGHKVVVKLFIEADGLAEECILTNASGDSALDDQTCRLLIRRGRFEPARGPSGLPVASWLPQTIVWPAIEQ